MVNIALNEIISVHKRYERFSARPHKEALEYPEEQFNYSGSKGVA